MPEKELLSQILSEYLTATPAVEDSARDALKSFCAYAQEWLIKSRVVGVGHTQNGMAVRLADGKEFSLFEIPVEVDPAAFIAVGITGNGGNSARAAMAASGADNTAVQITG
jgi:hypothetical protein